MKQRWWRQRRAGSEGGDERRGEDGMKETHAVYYMRHERVKVKEKPRPKRGRGKEPRTDHNRGETV